MNAKRQGQEVFRGQRPAVPAVPGETALPVAKQFYKIHTTNKKEPS